MDDYPPLERSLPQRHGILLLGFPSQPVADHIKRFSYDIRDLLGLTGWPLRTERFHMTLSYLGDYDRAPERLFEAVIKAFENFDHPPVDVSFNQVLSFGRDGFNRPLVLGSDQKMPELHRFRQKLALALLAAGIQEPARTSFTPHMTLLYDRRTIQPQEVDAIRWRLDEFVLVDSLRGQTKHVPIARWRLRGEPNEISGNSASAAAQPLQTGFAIRREIGGDPPILDFRHNLAHYGAWRDPSSD
jgi:2'-5' RNA ligase